MAVVNYLTLNIGELLHLLPCDLLRNNVRLIEKLIKRFINAKYGKIVNKTHTHPYIYIYICNSVFALKRLITTDNFI